MLKFFKKLIGHEYENRYKWGQFYWTLNPKQWDLSVRLYESWNDNNTDCISFSPLLFKLYIHLPTTLCQPEESWQRGNGKSYGFYVYPSIKNMESFVICMGSKSKHIDMPWTYKWYSSEVLDYNYKTAYYENRNMRRFIPLDVRWKSEECWKKETAQTYDYTYVRKNGEIQKRKATVVVERRVWTMRWLPWKKMTRTSIWVNFDEEIGEKVGSWKGGTTGCGWDITDGDTPEMTLRKMEKERKFE